MSAELPELPPEQLLRRVRESGWVQNPDDSDWRGGETVVMSGPSVRHFHLLCSCTGDGKGEPPEIHMAIFQSENERTYAVGQCPKCKVVVWAETITGEKGAAE